MRNMKQFWQVFDLMRDGQWRNLAEIKNSLGAQGISGISSVAGISARLRDFRKKKYGGFRVECKRIGVGQYRYRLAMSESQKTRWAATEDALQVFVYHGGKSRDAIVAGMRTKWELKSGMILKATHSFETTVDLVIDHLVVHGTIKKYGTLYHATGKKRRS